MSDNLEQMSLLSGDDTEFNWKKHWQDMPEFSLEDQTPVQKIIISFYSYEDAKEFGKLIGQKVTKRTNSLTYPKNDREAPKHFVYADETE